MYRATLIMGIALAASAACAGRQNPGAFAAEAVTTEPELVACAGYQPAPGGVGPIRAVQLQYVVKSDGLVDPNTITLVKPSGHAEAERRARDAARNCHYEPALRDGQPVASVVRRTFRFVI